MKEISQGEESGSLLNYGPSMLVKGSFPWSTVLLDGDIFPRQMTLLAFLTSECVGSCRQICEFKSFHMLEAHMRARKLCFNFKPATSIFSGYEQFAVAIAGTYVD